MMLSTTIRRLHMYLALFLGPWVLMYALSTFVMNHRVSFRGEPPAPPVWETISDADYPGEFPDGAGRNEVARQILAGLAMEGAHQVTVREGKVVILRNRAVRPVRITYDRPANRLLVERQVLEASAFLERMHRRRGFQHPYALEDLWAFSVDSFIAVMFIWALSGVWMWWEMKITRKWGLVSLLAGAALLTLCLAVL
jgi:hypothetical protein